jgi:hypothetical protein
MQPNYKLAVWCFGVAMLLMQAQIISIYFAK